MQPHVKLDAAGMDCVGVCVGGKIIRCVSYEGNFQGDQLERDEKEGVLHLIYWMSVGFGGDAVPQ